MKASISSLLATVLCTSHHLSAVSADSFPGPAHLHPTIHFTPSYVATVGGWHDIAGALTHKGVHHIYQGTGWNHAMSNDLVHWETGPHGPGAIHETYAGMDSNTDPCSGFLAKDDDGTVCAGFRQCGSNKGVDGGASWDVPLELRCALDDDLNTWSTQPDYLFNVSWWRSIPYDPARPWREADGNWYQLLSMDGCNTTTKALPCAEGGSLVMWKSPKLRGPGMAWEKVGPVFTTNETVLKDGHLSKEFVTIDFVGAIAGDPDGGSTRVFLNNVGGNGGGDGCCSGTTSYFPVGQKSPGAPFEPKAPQGMVDWGSFALKPQQQPLQPAGATGLDLLAGTSSRGLSMARTLGSEDADQVTVAGRRVLIGWTGPADGPAFGGQGSAQSLPRELSLASDHTLLQRFVPELEVLRTTHAAGSPYVGAGGQQAEVLAHFPESCAAAAPACGVTVLGDGANGTTVTLRFDLGLVTVDATTQGNTAVRAGPLPPAAEDSSGGGWSVHAVVDHSIVEIIVNNRTAFVVYAAPDTPGATKVSLVGAVPNTATLDVWELAAANNQ